MGWQANLKTLTLISIPSLIISLFISEGLVRTAEIAPRVIRLRNEGRPFSSAYEPSDNPLLGYTLKRSFRAEEFDCHHSFASTNSFGFRDIERDLIRSDKIKRIALLGDSVVAGHGLCELDQTISRQMEQLAPQDTLEVLNMGSGGYCTLAEVELFRERGAQFHPDYLILLFVGNDYVNQNSRMRFATSRPRMVEELFNRSELFRIAALKTDLFGFATDTGVTSDALDRLSESNVTQGFSLLAELAKRDGFTVVVATWPNFTDRGIEPAESALDPQVADAKLPDVEQLAKQYGFSFSRLESAFEEDLAKRAKGYRGRFRQPSPRWLYTIGDGTHPSPLGAEIGARALLKTVQPLNSSKG